MTSSSARPAKYGRVFRLHLYGECLTLSLLVLGASIEGREWRRGTPSIRATTASSSTCGVCNVTTQNPWCCPQYLHHLPLVEGVHLLCIDVCACCTGGCADCTKEHMGTCAIALGIKMCLVARMVALLQTCVVGCPVGPSDCT